jgi:ketosteroid isomerase-like protein
MKTTLAMGKVALWALLAGTVLPAAAEPAVISALRADKARLAAMMSGDGDALARLMSDQLRFVHSDGRVESKADYVKNMMAGDTAYADAKTSEVETMQVSPDVVVVLGVQEMRKRLGPTWSEIKLRYLAVWRNELGTWRMVAWQSARPSGNSTVPAKK